MIEDTDMKKCSLESDEGRTQQAGGSPVQAVRSLYINKYGEDPHVEVLDGAGSDRRYFRLTFSGKPSVIATWGENIAENMAFVSMAKTFRKNGCPVPEIYAENSDCSAYLQEDFGGCNLLSCLGGPDRMMLSAESLRLLVGIQTVDEDEWKDEVYVPEFGARQVMWDLNYFKYEFLKTCGFVFDEDSLEDDFESLCGALTGCREELKGFMCRDFQSRNIMVGPSGLGFIDFQGGRKGPLLYDAVSFLWQAKAGFTSEEREKLLAAYAARLSSVRGVGCEEILEGVSRFALFRTLQVLGAYGLRGLVERRAHFMESIPLALANLKELIDDGSLDAYPELKRVCVQAVGSRYGSVDKGSGLTVKVYSFSYKKGYPEDLSGNGGGFMFDCRGMHNPGRYDRYKPLTGHDAPVREFLEDRGEVGEFVSKSLSMVSPSVSRYLQRGFSSLQIGFGCTGGRHRSVYCAESLAGQLAERFPSARIELVHREQGIVKIYNDKEEGE